MVALTNHLIHVAVFVCVIITPVSGWCWPWRWPFWFRAPKRRSKAPSTAPTRVPTIAPTIAPITVPMPMAAIPTKVPLAQVKSFNLGVLTDLNSDNIRLSEGLSAKIIARSGKRVVYTSPDATEGESALKFHWDADGADIFALPDDGYIYVSNSEIGGGRGGVYGVEFDSQGRIRNYKVLASGTNRNCNGGRTPWSTWISCEEVGGGQCWQVDPTGNRTAQRTVIGGLKGGWFEAFAYDARNTDAPSYYVTEDDVDGPVRRYRPPTNTPMDWDSLHLSNGTVDYLEFLQGGQFQWTTSIANARISAYVYFQHAEGIAIHNGKLAFVSKQQKQLFILDLDLLTYTVTGTNTSTLPGGGQFEGQPDHLIVSSSSSSHNGVLILTEDSGSTPGMFAYDGSKYLSYFETNYNQDEVVGVAFSPDGKYLFAAVQRAGLLFQISRDDGQSFVGRRVLRYKKKDFGA